MALSHDFGAFCPSLRPMRSMGMWVCGISRSAATASYLCNIRITAGFMSWCSTVNRARFAVYVVRGCGETGVEQEDILTSCCLGSTRTAPSGSGIMPVSCKVHFLPRNVHYTCTLSKYRWQITAWYNALFIIMPSCDGASPMWPVVVSRRLEVSAAPLRAMRLTP